MIYLDSAAATRPLICAVETMTEVLRSVYANPNSAHAEGLRACRIIEAASATVAQCLDAYPDEVHFCTSATEAAALIHNTAMENGWSIKNHSMAHDSVYSLGEHFAGEDKKTLCFYSLVNNEIGTISLYKEKGEAPVLYAVDATAAVGNFFLVGFHGMNVSYLFCDAMKFGGIPGCGILLVKRGMPVPRWPHQATPHTALIAACAVALEEQTRNLDFVDRYEDMYNAITQYLRKEVDGRCIKHMGADAVNYILTIRFAGVEGTALAAMLSERGVMVSTGAACNSGSDHPSRILLSAGLSEQEAKETIRISFCSSTLTGEVEEAAKIIAECVKELRSHNQ